MRAWQVHELGAPADVLRLDDVDDLTPGPHEVVIAVEACALNFADTLLCEGRYQESPPLPFTPGLELAGTVVAAGSAAMHPVGARVVGSPLLPHGALAEQAVATSADVLPIPATMPAVDAAAMHVTYQTGWFALHRRAMVRPGETVLVHAGAGGVGSAAIQLAKAAGATVVATAGGADKVELCRTLGADHVVDYRTDDFVDVVNDVTDGAGADVVYDSVGGDTFTRSTKCIAWEGRILVIGAAAGTYAEARTNHAMVKTYSIVGLNWGGYRTRRPELVHEAHDELVRLHAEGAIAPLVSEVLPLDALPDALVRLASRGTTGKVVLTP
ncbi:MAG: NADPH:quinone oxidoreductase family protein [Acidimicrobiales bacterium]